MTDNSQNICSPLFSLLGINYFSFYRVYSDGQRIRLTTNPNWAKHYYENDYFRYGQIERHPHLYESGIALWDHWPKDTLAWKTVGKDAQENFDIDHGFNIVKQQGDFMDVFELTAPPTKPEINNIYLRYLDSIYNFITYFYSQAAPLIHIFEKNKLNFPIDNDIFFRKDESGLFKTENTFSGSSNTVLAINGFSVEITKREMEALTQIFRGKTAKEAAKALSLSPRTIEDYIQRVREKTGLKSRSELFEKLFLQFFGFTP